MSQGLIDAGWRELAQQALTDAPPSKVTTCHAFFFAGAAHCLYLLMEELSGDEVSPEKGVALLSAIDEELEAFRLRLEVTE